MSTWQGREAASVGDAEEGLWNLDEDELDNDPPLLVLKPLREDEAGMGMSFGGGMGMGSSSGPPSRANSLPGSKHASPRKSVTTGTSSPLSSVATLQVPIPLNISAALAVSPRMRGRNLSPERRQSPSSAALSTPVDTPTGQATEYLKFLAEHAKNVNIVMELSLEGQEVQYINNAINEVTGRAPEDVLFCPITDVLHTDDSACFADATKALLADPEGTIQLRVHFEVKDLVDSFSWTAPRPEGPVYIELEGVGMLMKESDEPSHTMWVLKAVPATDTAEVAFLVNDEISTEEILCRICEREIAAWFFEKHNETCDAVHRLEAEIVECGECLNDLRTTVLDHISQLDQPEEGEFKGLLLLTLPESVTESKRLSTEPQLVQRRKIIREQLEDVADILLAASEITTPSVGEEDDDIPFYLQRYLDPESEEKLARITKWRQPPTTDRAMAMLFGHVEEQVRRKQKAVARMMSTIRYSEKTRHEWEDKVMGALQEMEGSVGSGSGSGDESGSESGSVGRTGSPTGEGIGDKSGHVADVSIATTVGTDIGTGNSPPNHRKIAPKARLPVTLGHHGRTATYGDGSSTVPPTPGLQSIAPSRSRSATTKADLNSEAARQLAEDNRDDADDPSPKTIPTAQVPKPMSIPMPPLHKGPFKQITPVQSPLLSPLLAPTDFPTRHVRRPSKAMRDAPLSPRIPSAAISRPPPPSIKDFEIIKPISRGAFGSVFLAKKVTTGDYYAIKALKKSDMIAKNQITNVKAERTILINQASSPHVAKLFFSFQSKEYLYLVMEYLNGGDCATLIKTLQSIPEEWAKNYIAEVTLGLEYLHGRGIVHRDIKPDNLLIDSRGHLKLTDFGLSRMGLLNRQGGAPRPLHLRRSSARELRQRPFVGRTSSMSSTESPLLSPEYLPPPPTGQSIGQSYFNTIQDPGSADESSGSESVGVIPKHMRQPSIATSMSSEPNSPLVSGRDLPKFVGTPDYLAPESILGIGADDSAVDWWALGVVLYEFLYGIPPFHDESPEKVFDNVVSRRIDWHEDEIEISPEARDLMDRLMCSNPADRLGAKGAEEVKAHPFFNGIDWDTITSMEASFVPEVTDPESTDYFDSRGAIHGFHDDDPPPQVLRAQHYPAPSPNTMARMGAIVSDIRAEKEREQEDFGAFNFKNLPVLKQANDDMIRKLRRESMSQMSSISSISASLEAPPTMRERPRSVSAKVRIRRNPSDVASISTALGSASMSGPSTGTGTGTGSGSGSSPVAMSGSGSMSVPSSISAGSGMGLSMGRGMGMHLNMGMPMGMGIGIGMGPGPPSPSTSTSSAASTPSRSSAAPMTPNMAHPIPILPALSPAHAQGQLQMQKGLLMPAPASPVPSNASVSATSTSASGSIPPNSQIQALGHGSSHAHFRRPSELSVSALDRVKSSDDSDHVRRASAPHRVRAGSGGSITDRSTSMELWRQRRQASLQTDPVVSGGSVPTSSGMMAYAQSAGPTLGSSVGALGMSADGRGMGQSPPPSASGSASGSSSGHVMWHTSHTAHALGHGQFGHEHSLSTSTSASSVPGSMPIPLDSPELGSAGVALASASASGTGGSPGSMGASVPMGAQYFPAGSGYGFVDRSLDVLIAEDNPISQKILETLLTRMGCRCVCVEDGPQTLAATMGSIRFDVIFCDMHMPVVNGEQVARMIRSTNNHNQNTPIVAVTSYEQHSACAEEGTLFSAVLSKPVSKSDLTSCFGRLGFVFASTSASISGSALDEASVSGPGGKD